MGPIVTNRIRSCLVTFLPHVASRGGSERPSTIKIEVRSKIRSDAAPISLELPWPYAAALARTIVKAAHSLDHAALDAIAELFDSKQ